MTKNKEEQQKNKETDVEEDFLTEDDAMESTENPHLTGEEETVEAEESDHREPDAAQGQVKPEAKSPLNTDPKTEKEPSEETDAPEGDAEYSEKQEEAGMKNEEDND